MKRIASKVPTIPIEMAKLRSIVDKDPCDPDEAPCDAEEELDEDEDEDAVPDEVLVLLLVCDVEEIIDEVPEGSRTSKMNISTIENSAPAGTVI